MSLNDRIAPFLEELLAMAKETLVPDPDKPEDELDLHRHRDPAY